MTPAEITALRKRLGLTQAEFAAMVGVSRRTIIRAEDDAGEAPPLLATTYRLLAALGERALDALAEPSSDP